MDSITTRLNMRGVHSYKKVQRAGKLQESSGKGKKREIDKERCKKSALSSDKQRVVAGA